MASASTFLLPHISHGNPWSSPTPPLASRRSCASSMVLPLCALIVEVLLPELTIGHAPRVLRAGGAHTRHISDHFASIPEVQVHRVLCDGQQPEYTWKVVTNCTRCCPTHRPMSATRSTTCAITSLNVARPPVKKLLSLRPYSVWVHPSLFPACCAPPLCRHKSGSPSWSGGSTSSSGASGVV